MYPGTIINSYLYGQVCDFASDTWIFSGMQYYSLFTDHKVEGVFFTTLYLLCVIWNYEQVATMLEQKLTSWLLIWGKGFQERY